MATLDFSRTVAAPPEVVFEVLTDHRGMADFSHFRRVELEREGEPPPDGLGAIRALHLVGPPVREEVTVYEPPRRFAYRLLSGMPARDHEGTIELSPAGEGTRMSYVIETTPALPGIGFALVAILRRVVEEIASGIAVRAEERARSAS